MAKSFEQQSGLLAWFASNPVAANLLMALIFLGGLSCFSVINTEVFPQFNPPVIEIEAVYPGAGPQETEEAVCIPIENAVFDIEGIKQLDTKILPGECLITIKVLPSYDKQQVINTVRSKVQGIQRLPKNLEKINVMLGSRENDAGLIWVALHGPTDTLTLKRYGEQIQQQLAVIPGVTRAKNYGIIPYEIAIEIPSNKLHQYELSLHDITEALRKASIDLPAGLVKNPAGEQLLKINGKATTASELAALPLRILADGTHIKLGDIATIKDGLEENLSEWHHNGENAQGWEIHADHDAVKVAERINEYVKKMQPLLPQGLSLKTWWDESRAFHERISTLLEDGLSGFLLVCLVLTLFLHFNVAIWASIGILTSILGALWLMPLLDVSLNMLSLFGFLLAMGILVDDAIIIGDSIYHQQLSNPQQTGLSAAINGVQQVAVPVILAVLVALVAFLPGLFLSGWVGQMMRPICIIIILTLIFSLIEAMLILPAHLASHSKQVSQPSKLDHLRTWLNNRLDAVVNEYYRPFLKVAIEWRYLTITCFILLVIISSTLVISDRVRQSFQPDVIRDSFWVHLTVPEDAPYSEISDLSKKVEQAFLELQNEMDTMLSEKQKSWFTTKPEKVHAIGGLETMVFIRQAGFWTEFTPEGRQHIVVEDFIRQWRKRIGDIGRGKIDFIYKEGDVPFDLEFDLSSSNVKDLSASAEFFKTKLAAYTGVSDINDSAEFGKPEIKLNLKPNAQRLGVQLEDLAEQVRYAYYGDEVYRFQRSFSEVKLIVRLPIKERRSLDSLKNLPIKLASGFFVPLDSLADIQQVKGYAQLIRQNRQRILKVQARVDPQLADVNAIYLDIEKHVLPTLQHEFSGLTIALGQSRQEQEATTDNLGHNSAMALIVIYVLIAVPFRSYLKPLIFLLSAPVAWSGGVLAHWFLGLPLSMESLIGMIAASGVVINDSLVLLDTIRETSDGEQSINELINDACSSRFRPIFLAFLTNFAGFLPTLLETSQQAQFLIPMTLSLSAGLLIGMLASLVLTPVCYSVIGKH